MSSRHRHNPTTLIAIAATVFALGACQPAVESPPLDTVELSDSAWPTDNDGVNPDRLVESAHSLVTRYLETTDAITRDGGTDPQAMARLTTTAWFPTEQAGFAHYRTEGLRTIGDTVFDSLVVLSVFESVTGDLHVDVIACVDATWVWLLPANAPDPPDGLIEWLQSGQDVSDVLDEDYEQWSEYLETVSPQAGEREAIVFWLVGATANSLAIDGTINWEGAHACHTTVID